MQEPDRGWGQGPVRVWRPQGHYVWRRALDWCMSPGRPHTELENGSGPQAGPAVSPAPEAQLPAPSGTLD